MIIADLIKELESLAPQSMGKTGDIYGLQYGEAIGLNERVVEKVLICVDPTMKALQEAEANNIHFIISHHGIMHSPSMHFNDDLLGQMYFLASKHISLFVIHTPWDSAQNGVTESFATKANLQILENLPYPDSGKEKFLGRIAQPIIENTTFGALAKNLKRTMNIPCVKLHGDVDQKITKVAVAGGKSISGKILIKAKNLGANLFLCGECSHPDVLQARALKMGIIETTHYASEAEGMKSLKRILSLRFPNNEFIFYNEEQNTTVF